MKYICSISKNCEISNIMETVNSSASNISDIFWKNISEHLEEISSWSEFVNEDGNEAIKIITCIKTTITLIGLLANISTLLSLILNGHLLPLIGRILLIHQAVVDTFVCLMAIGIYNQTWHWETGNATLDLLICQIWHGQAIYWGAVLLSVWNVVLIAFERFILLNHPVEHRNLQQNVVYKSLAAMYLFSVICLIPAYLQVKYDRYYGKCVWSYYIDGDVFKCFMMFYGVFWFFVVYAVPIGILIILYTKIILKLRERRNKKISTMSQQRQEPSIIDLAHRQITKTAVAIAIVYIIFLSWESFYCLLGFTEVIKYEFNKPLQVTGIFLATICSCSTPFIYAVFMPIFRKSVKKTFGCRNRYAEMNQNNNPARSTRETTPEQIPMRRITQLQLPSHLQNGSFFKPIL